MLRWTVKGIAALSVIALIIACAAEFTTLIGDLKSVGSATSFSNTFGIMLVKSLSRRKQGGKCEAYKKGTDFPQRPGAITSAVIYHIITLVLLVFLIIHQTFRAILPRSLPALFRFLPVLSGKTGLIGSGAVMLYLGLQILSYSVGAVHATSAILLVLVALVNIPCGFVSKVVGCAGEDPSFAGGGMGAGPGDMGGGDMYGPPPPGMDGPPLDGGFDGDFPPPGPPGGPDPGTGAPDPYDDGSGPGHDGGVDGVGASAPPPGVIEKSQAGQTFGQPPPGLGNAQPVMPGGTAQNVVLDPATGQWKAVAQPPMAQLPMTQAAVGYDAYGRPILGPAPPILPGAAGWPGLLPQYPPPVAGGAESSPGKEKDPKKIARQEARREFDRIRTEQEEREAAEARRAERKARQKERDRERRIRREERDQTEAARARAARDAYQNLQVEEAEEDARRRQSRELMEERRQQAIDDARRQAIEREKAYYAVAQDWQGMGEGNRADTVAPGANRSTEQEGMHGSQVGDRNKLQTQTLALRAAHQAATAGRPLTHQAPAPNLDRDSFLSGGGMSVRDGPVSLLPLPPMPAARPSSQLLEHRNSVAPGRHSPAQMPHPFARHSRPPPHDCAERSTGNLALASSPGNRDMMYPPGSTDEERELAYMRMQASEEAKKRYTESTTMRQLEKEQRQGQANTVNPVSKDPFADPADGRVVQAQPASPAAGVTFDFTAVPRPQSVAAKSFSTLKPEDQKY